MWCVVTRLASIIAVSVLAATACSGRQPPVEAQCAPSAISESEDPVSALAVAYFRSRGAFTELEDIPRFGPLRIESRQAAVLVGVGHQLAAQVVVAHRIAVLAGFEEASEELFLAVADLWRAIGVAEAATEGRTLDQPALEALSTLIEVAMVVTEDLYDVLDATVSTRIEQEPQRAGALRCFQARFRAFEQWARYMDYLEEESLNLTEEESIVADSGGDAEFHEELQVQRRLIAEHRETSRRALTHISDRTVPLDRITADLDDLDALENVSLDEVRSATATAHEACP